MLKIKTKKMFFAALLFAGAGAFAQPHYPCEWPLDKSLRHLDKNGDNFLSPAEIGGDAALLERFDMDKDGAITYSEIEFVEDKEKAKKKYPDYVKPAPLVHKAFEGAPKKYKNVLLISLDGFDRRKIHEHFKAGEMPNLKALNGEGNASTLQILDRATCTKVGHATMLTGLRPETVRVVSNSKFHPIPRGYTIFERVKERNPDMTTVFISSKHGNVGAQTAEEANATISAKEPADYVSEGGPYLLAKEKMDFFDDADKLTEETAKAALPQIAKLGEKPFLMFLHFRSPDLEGHKYGGDTPEAYEARKLLDVKLGEIFALLKARGLYDDTLILVTTDHGWDPENAKGHKWAPDTWLISNCPRLRAEGLSVDVAPTVLDNFNVDISSLKPAPNGKSLLAN